MFVKLVLVMVIENAFIPDVPDVCVNPQEEILHPLKKGFGMSITSHCFILHCYIADKNQDLCFPFCERKNTVMFDFS